METAVFNLNLQDFRTINSKVFTGRPRGKDVRVRANIDNIEPDYDQIQITIPEDIASINPSFLEEFLENVVTRLGKQNFLKKFIFINTGRYKIEEDLEEAIDRILRDDTALTQ